MQSFLAVAASTCLLVLLAVQPVAAQDPKEPSNKKPPGQLPISKPKELSHSCLPVGAACNDLHDCCSKICWVASHYEHGHNQVWGDDPGMCKEGAHGRGDPEFTTFDGRVFQFQGQPNATFSVLSERDHQLNVYLTPATMFDHKGTYMHAFGLRHNSNKVNVTLLDGGQLKIELNNASLAMKDKHQTTVHHTAIDSMGKMNVHYELYKPFYGSHVTITTPLIELALWSVTNTVDEGGLAQPDYLHMSITLLARPANGVMTGIVGRSYGKQADPQAELQDEHVKMSGLFDYDCSDCLFQRKFLVKA